MTYTIEITQHTLSQRSSARSGIENSRPKGKAKVKGGKFCNYISIKMELF